MEIKPVTEDLSVSSQITVEDIRSVAEQGYRSIICNRPDDEGADQPSFAEISKAAEAAGISARYVPVVAGQIHDDDVLAFRRAISELPEPVLAYCRSGARSAMLWSMIE